MLILASQSPRRKELLGLLNIPFECIVADIDETIDTTKDLNEEMKKVSYLKAYEVFKEHQDDIVIGADTIVVLNGEILLKPKDEEDAFNTLQKLSGNTHEVKTGVTIISKDRKVSFVSNSHVMFSKLSDQEILDYIATKEPMDKAGSYGIQGYGAKFIENINGDYYSIMGFPIQAIYQKLKEFM